MTAFQQMSGLLLINYIIKDTIPCAFYTESSENTIDRDSSFIPGSPNPKHHTESVLIITVPGQ